MDIFVEDFLKNKLEAMKANHLFESSMDQFNIEYDSIYEMVNAGYFLESSEEYIDMMEGATEKVLTAIKEFFAKLRDAMKELISKIKFKFETMLAKREMNKKLESIKKALSANHELKAQLNKDKYSSFDSAKYVDACKKFINWYTTETKKLFNKQYKNVDEYNAAMDSLEKQYEAKRDELDLDNDDAYVIGANFEDFYKKTEKEAENWKKICDMFDNEFQAAVKEYEAIANGEEDPSKVSDIKGIASKFNYMVSNALHKVTHGIMSNLHTVLGVAGAVTGFAVAAKTGADGDEAVGAIALSGAAGYIAGKKGKDIYDKKSYEKWAKARTELNQKLDKLNHPGSPKDYYHYDNY